MKHSDESVADCFRKCGIGSKFYIAVGPVLKRKLPPSDTWKIEEIPVRVAATCHTKHSLTFEVFFFRDGKRCDKRYLDLDIRKEIWTYSKEEKRGHLMRSDPRIVTKIFITRCKRII